jgi:hypothetical protein
MTRRIRDELYAETRELTPAELAAFVAREAARTADASSDARPRGTTPSAA